MAIKLNIYRQNRILGMAVKMIKKIHRAIINNLVMKYTKDPDSLVNELNNIKDFGDYYRIKLSEFYCEKTPNIEEITGKNLVDVLIEKNNALREMYEDSAFYFGDNLPDITYITQALSSFAPLEASQSDIKYLKSPIPMDNLANSLVTGKH
nr:hypothetical protein [Yersinia enterocolitica]